MYRRITVTRFSSLRWLLPALLSGVLLAGAYPPFGVWGLAWIALVPLAAVAVRAGKLPGFRAGWIAGFCYWFVTLNWLRHVTVVGWSALSAYCAVYWGMFVWLWRRLGRLAEGTRPYWILPVVGATWWTGLEFLRATLFTGFSWNQLGVSQYENVILIQLSELGGVYLVSWLVALFNLALAGAMGSEARRTGWRRWVGVYLAVSLAAAACGYGRLVLNRSAGLQEQELRVGLVQPNVPQRVKWDEAFVDEIYQKLERLTRRVAATDPDLIVWPETALPDFLRLSDRSYGLVTSLATNYGIPLLVGTMDVEWDETGSPIYYNTSFLVGPDGTIWYRYDKQHLVMFGEYVPLGRWLPFIRALTPLEEDFTPGEEPVVMLVGRGTPATVLICFEDTIPGLARAAVRRGARLIINQTNDAWFDPSAGSWQHLANAVFRCVENRVPAVRCTNSGITSVVDEWGRICDVLADSRMNPRVEGVRTVRLMVPVRHRLSLYQQWGDWFGWSCVLLSLVSLRALQKRGGR